MAIQVYDGRTDRRLDIIRNTLVLVWDLLTA